MLNIIELESRWVKYKIKSYLPHLTILISLIVITVLILSFTQNSSIKSSSEKATKREKVTIIHTPVVITQPEVVIKEEKKVIKQQVIREKQVKPIIVPIHKNIHTNLKLSPSLDFMKKMQNSVQPYYMNDRTNSNDYILQDTHVSPVVTESVTSDQLQVKTSSVEPTIKKISIKRQNTQNDIHDIIKRFKNNNNPALSLFVAKKYYELGNYQQSYNYALITNKINQEIETSWIIFTKSLVKLGKKDKAISTLKKYIKQSHSSGAQILLDEIRTGKFQ